MNKGFAKTELMVLAVVIRFPALIAFGDSLRRNEEERTREEIENMREIALAYKTYVAEPKLETKGAESWFKEGKLIGPSSRSAASPGFTPLRMATTPRGLSRQNRDDAPSGHV